MNGDYDTIVGDDKQLFMNEWDAKYSTTIIDVRSGSIIVEHSGSQADIDSVTDDVTQNGVTLPSFGTLSIGTCNASNPF